MTAAVRRVAALLLGAALLMTGCQSYEEQALRRSVLGDAWAPSAPLVVVEYRWVHEASYAGCATSSFWIWVTAAVSCGS